MFLLAFLISFIHAEEVVDNDVRMVLTYEAPGVTNSTAAFSEKYVFTFDDFVLDTTAFQLSLPFEDRISVNYNGLKLTPADDFGGDSLTNYPIVNPYNTTMIKLSRAVNYFGCWITSLDKYNILTFSNEGHPIFILNPSSILTAIGDQNQYFNHPQIKSTKYRNEIFVFVNFFCYGCVFDQLSFYQSQNRGKFESENHTYGTFSESSGVVIETEKTTLPPREVTDPFEDKTEPALESTVEPTEEVTTQTPEEPTEEVTTAPPAEDTTKTTEEPTEEVTTAPPAEDTTKTTEEPTEEVTTAPPAEDTTKTTEEPTEEVTTAPPAEDTTKTTEEPTEEVTTAPPAEVTTKTTEEPTEEVTTAPPAEDTTAPTEEPTEEVTTAPPAEDTTKTTEEPTEEVTTAPPAEDTTAPDTDPDTEESSSGVIIGAAFGGAAALLGAGAAAIWYFKKGAEDILEEHDTDVISLEAAFGHEEQAESLTEALWV